MERHRQATQTAGRLAGQTAQTAQKFAKGVGQAWQSASDTKLAQAGRVAVKQGLKRQQKAIDTLAPKVGRAAGRAAANVPAIRDTYKAGQKLGRALRAEDYEYILSHLLDEGYASTAEGAEVIMVNMSEDWRDDILQQLDEISDRRVESAKRKLMKRTDRSLGSGKAGDFPEM